MSDWAVELASSIKEAIDSGERRTITVPNSTRKMLAETALARMGTKADAARITFEVKEK
jgi:hypothetical protein